MMNFEFYKEKLLLKYKEQNNEEMYERYEHSINVSKMCVELIERLHLNIDIEKAKIAGILHDYAKFCTKDEFEIVVLQYGLDTNMLNKSYKIWHALLGRYIVEKELDIHDEEILSAIQFHTTGKANMSSLEELLFVCDFIEIGRIGEQFSKARDIAFVNLKKAIFYILDYSFKYIVERGFVVDDLTRDALDYYRRYKNYHYGEKLDNVLECINKNLVKDVVIYDMRERSPLYDFAIVCTSASTRQMQAAYSYLRDDFAIKGAEFSDSWTLIDLGDILLHIFTDEERKKYGLDKLYAGVPIIENKVII